MSQFGRKFDIELDKHITGNYGEDQFEKEEDFVDRQVFDMEVRRLNNVIKTQGNLIDKLNLWEKKINDNLNNILKQLIEYKENKEAVYFAGENFVKLGKVEKNTKINNVNIQLLKIKFDNLDKFIQNNLIKNTGKFTKKQIKEFQKDFLNLG